MSCIPESGGCERPFTEAFVEHLNQTGGSHYVHRACLDRIDSMNPQPEALYVDSEQDLQLVIERKSISWPIDYPYRHKKSHFVTERFCEELTGLPPDDLYELRLPMLIEGKESELRAFALKAARQIRSQWSQVAAGSILKGIIDDRWPWAFGKVPDWEKEDDAPSKGLKFTFVGSSSVFDYVDPTNLPAQLASALLDIYSRCVRKFASYPEARRVLALDPHADLRYRDKDWWQGAFSALPPPAEINETWLGVFDWVAEDLEGWVFERLR
jgi:hypothetical protein